MGDDILKRAAVLVEKQKAWDAWEYPSKPAPPAMVEGEIATLINDMTAEIARLRAALANARREGMEEAQNLLETLHKNHKYNPRTGEGSEHDAGYYRALAEGAVHILYAAAKVDAAE